VENLVEFYSAARKMANLDSMPRIGSFDFFYQGIWWFGKKDTGKWATGACWQ
jgi:hypothetical protein